MVGERHCCAFVGQLVQVAGFHVMWVFGVIGRVVLGIVLKTKFRSRRGWSEFDGSDYGRDVQMWCMLNVGVVARVC